MEELFEDDAEFVVVSRRAEPPLGRVGQEDDGDLQRTLRREYNMLEHTRASTVNTNTDAEEMSSEIVPTPISTARSAQAKYPTVSCFCCAD